MHGEQIGVLIVPVVQAGQFVCPGAGFGRFARFSWVLKILVDIVGGNDEDGDFFDE